MENKKDEFGLDLADYKSVEAEAMVQLREGKKIVMASELMLSSARLNIKLLGGKTSLQEDELAREEQKKQLRATTG